MFSYFIGYLPNSVVISAIIGVAIIYYYSSCTYKKWHKLNVPCAPTIPLFGHAFKMMMFLESQAESFDAIYRRFPDEKICGFYQMQTPFLMVRDPELICAILIKDFSHFTDHGVEIDPEINMLARSLFFATGQKWKTMRQKLSPGFSSGKIKATFDQIKECSEQLISSISDKSNRLGPIETNRSVGEFAIDVIGTCAFGLKLDTITNENSEFRKNTADIFGRESIIRKIQLTIGLALPKIAKFFKLQIFSKDAINFFHSVITELISFRTENSVIRNDLAQTLMQARNELVLNAKSTDEDKFIDLDIIANAIMLFSGGAEPISITVSYCLYELALNKDIQDKLRDEINVAKQRYDGKFTSEYLTELHYTEMVVNETLRKYSIAIVLSREATENYSMPGGSLLIEKGQKIIIPMYSIHHDAKYYPNPDIFDPERFNAEEKSKRPNGTFIPFGDGPRFCIAKRFAELQMKLVLSEILSKFEVLPCEKTEVPLKISMVPGPRRPKNGIWLTFKPIKLD